MGFDSRKQGIGMTSARTRERLVDRLPYLRHVFRLWLSPSTKDKAFLPLPQRLEFLCILLKPFRLLRDRLRRPG